jgi:uncharacterized membrane protein
VLEPWWRWVAVGAGLTVVALTLPDLFRPFVWRREPNDYWIFVDASRAANPYDVEMFRWSPVAAWIFALIAPLGLGIWRLVHLAAVAFVQPAWAAGLVMLAWPFWRDVLQGNTMTFVVVAGWLALRGNRPAVIAFYALAMLMPRPLMLPVMIWLLWHERWSWRWFAGLFGINFALVLASGHAAEWLGRLAETSQAEILRPFNWLPSRWIGLAWVPIGLALAAVLTMRGRLGLASLAASPYLLSYYWLVLLWELWRVDLPRPGSGRMREA